MSILKNLVRVSFAAVLAIGLAACGGGSGTTMATTVLDPAGFDSGPDGCGGCGGCGKDGVWRGGGSGRGR